MRFRPCIDLHQGKVKQIVGASLRDDASQAPTENFVSPHSPAWFARKYRRDGLAGGHVIQLGPGNENAAREALAAWPGGLQLGGGITPENASAWLEAGAAALVVTSFLFADGEFSPLRLDALRKAIPRERLVLDLSCRKVEGRYVVACQRWQKLTSLQLSRETFLRLGEVCAEFLVHAVEVEGMRGGIDQELVERLAQWCPFPVTYAGGIRSLEDVERLRVAGEERVDFTVGSALDLFGGTLPYDQLKRFNGTPRT
ncbi:MAG: phosphoribosylformimino-5-aminoimidazole carboxamide ribotide isomerase [Oligosphaeraceae bacterium]